MKALSVNNISKRFGQQKVLQDIALDVDPGNILALAGESGSGKTTLLRIIGGLEFPDSGSINIGNRDITRLKPASRKIGFVFQNLALFPHLNVYSNIGFALKAGRKEKTQKVASLLEMTGLEGLQHRLPHELSGGQQQRVALARALTNDPDLLLLDEPFSNLDELIKAKVRTELLELIKSIGITSILVTHQASDAFMISDDVVIINGGHILQKGSPIEVYRDPVSPYVSRFFGSSVLLDASAEDDHIKTSFGIIPWKGETPPQPTFSIFIRPEHVALSEGKTPGTLHAVIRNKIFKGPHEILLLDNQPGDASIELETEQSSFEPGDTISLSPDPNKMKLFA